MKELRNVELEHVKTLSEYIVVPTIQGRQRSAESNDISPRAN